MRGPDIRMFYFQWPLLCVSGEDEENVDGKRQMRAVPSLSLFVAFVSLSLCLIHCICQFCLFVGKKAGVVGPSPPATLVPQA